MTIDNRMFQAEKALTCDETPVGCVFVHGDRVVGRGMNDTNKSLNVGPLAASCKLCSYVTV